MNGQSRQDAVVSDMIWNVAEIIAQASRLWRLAPGDLIFTGTPEGVGPIARGDRVEGAVLGRYRRLASEEHSPYVVPQCFGQRSGTRWLSAAAPERGALVISAEQPFVHTAHRYSDGQLTRALHADELKPEDAVFVHLDAAHRGVGTASCGPDAAARHLIRAGRHQLSLTLSWVEPGAERSDGSGQ